MDQRHQRDRRRPSVNSGGATGIRTPETVSRLLTFQVSAFDHSAIAPQRSGVEIAGIPDFRRGGESGIRTLGRLSPTPHFECGALNHSANSPLRSNAWRNH